MQYGSAGRSRMFCASFLRFSRDKKYEGWLHVTPSSLSGTRFESSGRSETCSVQFRLLPGCFFSGERRCRRLGKILGTVSQTDQSGRGCSRQSALNFGHVFRIRGGYRHMGNSFTSGSRTSQARVRSRHAVRDVQSAKAMLCMSTFLQMSYCSLHSGIVDRYATRLELPCEEKEAARKADISRKRGFRILR